MPATSLNLDSGECLRFVGEGNEHVVFGLKDSDCVLRFRKFSPEDMIRREEFLLRVSSDLAFINDVARPLAGPLLVDKARLVSVDPCLLEKVMKRIRPLRDEKRLLKVINRFGIGILTPNVVTEFIDRNSDLEINPKILNFSLSADVITIHSTFFPFSRHSMINSVSNISCIGRIGSTASSLSQNTHSFQESLKKKSEEKKSMTLLHDRSGARTKESQIQMAESPPLCGDVNPSFHSVSREQTKESEKGGKVGEDEEDDNPQQNQSKDCRNGRSETLKKDESQTGTNLEEFGAGLNPIYDDYKGDCVSSTPCLVCIELKPKQGYLELGPKGSTLCRFCLKQYLKVETKTEEFRSSYCPRDLFSGNHPLMLKALHNLFSAPQNNLKIFVDGKRARNLNQYRYLSELILLILTYDTMGTGARPESKPLTSEGSPDHPETRDLHFSPSPQLWLAGRSNKKGTTLRAAAVSSPNCDAWNQTRFTAHLASVCGTPETSSKDFEEVDLTDSPEANSPLVPILPQGSILSPSSFLGKILYLQSLGRIPEVQAAILYRELINRIPGREALHKSLRDFKFLRNKCGPQESTMFTSMKSEEHQKHTPKMTKTILSQNLLASNLFYVEGVEEFKGNICDLDFASICQLLQQCLVAMSAKDASLMMLIEGPYDRCKITHSETLPVTSPFWLEFPSMSGKWHKCQVSLVDVALKSPHKIREHESALGKLEDILTKLKAEGVEPPCCEKKKGRK